MRRASMRLPVTLSLRSSVTLAAVLFLVHGLAIIMVLVTDLPSLIKLGLWIALAFSVWRSVFVHALRRSVHALMAITLRSDGELEIKYRNGEFVRVQVDDRTTIFSWLVVLLVKREGRTLALTLPHDALGEESHRQLRLWLRWVAETENQVRQG